jgi:hypothetical protein
MVNLTIFIALTPSFSQYQIHTKIEGNAFA